MLLHPTIWFLTCVFSGNQSVNSWRHWHAPRTCGAMKCLQWSYLLVASVTMKISTSTLKALRICTMSKQLVCKRNWWLQNVDWFQLWLLLLHLVVPSSSFIPWWWKIIATYCSLSSHRTSSDQSYMRTHYMFIFCWNLFPVQNTFLCTFIVFYTEYKLLLFVVILYFLTL